MEVSKAGSVCGQCLEGGRRCGGLEEEEEQEEEEENKEDRVPSCSLRALQAHWPGCVLLLLLHFDL